ncbi:MAG: sugar phosphate isomerase/epimerase family protein [Chloroflexota bacterium]|nr:sugar phosphate isomerase/epimerase family protein [Chloroflexota bacterium]
MNVCMHNWMRPEPIERTIERLAALGYDGIQIMGEPRKYDHKQVRELLDKHKLQCFGSVSIMIKGRDLLHADPYYRDMAVAYCCEIADMVANLGGNFFTLVPSEVGKVVAMDTPEQEWAWAVEGIRKVAKHAKTKGVKIGLEPLNRFETNFLNRHDQAIKLMEDVAEENVGVCLDAFHINIEEDDMYEAIRKTAPYLVDFHVADNNRRAPGEGAIDWSKLISTLKEAGYNGQLTVEFVVPFDRSPLAHKMEDAGTTATEAELKFIRDHGSDLMADAEYTRHCEQAIKHLRKSGA